MVVLCPKRRVRAIVRKQRNTLKDGVIQARLSNDSMRDLNSLKIADVRSSLSVCRFFRAARTSSGKASQPFELSIF